MLNLNKSVTVSFEIPLKLIPMSISSHLYITGESISDYVSSLLYAYVISHPTIIEDTFNVVSTFNSTLNFNRKE